MSNQKEKQPFEIDSSEAETIIKTNFGLTGGSVKQRWGTNQFFYNSNSYWWQRGTISIDNPFEAKPSPDGYLLKIMNSSGSKEEVVQAQNALMIQLREKGIKTKYPLPTVQGDYYAKIKLPLTPFDVNRKPHILRLFVHVPGTKLTDVKVTFSFLYKIGVFQGNVSEALKGFSHPFPKTHTSIWRLESVPRIKSITNVIQNPTWRLLVDDVIDTFTQDVLPHADDFQKGIIYSEFNAEDIKLVHTDGSPAIVNLGDVHESNSVFELGYALCDMMLECERSSVDPVAGAGHFMAGYKSIRPSFDVDFRKIRISICARLCQGLVLGINGFRGKRNRHFVLRCKKYGWSVLEKLWETSDERLARVWNRIIPF